MTALITLEHLLYALILLGGLAARLAALGAAPLSPEETSASWPAWLDAWDIGIAHAQAPTSALLHALQVVTFWISGGGTDWLARLPVVLISAVLVVLPWFWRSRLGRPAALVLSLLLALDPWLLALGRMADSAMLSVTLALCALTALEQSRESSRGAAYAAAISIGLLLVSGPQAWSWLPVLGLYWLLLRPSATPADASGAEPEAGSRSADRFGPLLAGAAAAILGATGWLAQPQELAMVSESLSSWLRHFSSGPYGFGYPWLRLMVDQPFALVFAIVGIGSLWRSREAAPGERRFLTGWLLWGILLLLLPGRMPATLPVLGVPLLVAAALGVQSIFRLAQDGEDWHEAGLLALVIGGVLLSLLFWAATFAFSQTPPVVPGLIAAAIVLLTALLLIGFAFFAGNRQAVVVGLGVSGLFLLAASLASSWQLAYQHAASRPDGFVASTSLIDARALADDVQALSLIRTGDATELEVQLVAGPSLQPDAQTGWLLRKMRNLKVVAAPEIDETLPPQRAPLVVTTPLSQSESWTTAYVGSEYRLRSAWLTPALPSLTGYADRASAWSGGWRPRLRWLLYREAAAPQPGTAILWAAP